MMNGEVDERGDEQMTTTKTLALCMGVALLAGGAGLMAGLLTAPASGPETRRRWVRRAEDEVEALERKGRRAVEDATRQARKFVDGQIDRGKEALSNLGDD